MAHIKQPWSTFFNDLETGDIILMHGLFESSFFIEKFSGSEWSHAAVAVRPEDIGVKGLPKGTILLWESNIKDDPDDGHVKDVILKKTKDGPMLDVLKERITNNFDMKPKKDDSNFAKRKLNFKRNQAMFDKLKSVIKNVHSNTFPAIPRGEMESFFKGVFNEPVTDNTFFCSQLVAHTYKAWGLLGNDWVDNSYIPANFSVGKRDSKLLKGATLGQEIWLDTTTIPAYPGTK
jgi:hypothetical protein